MPSTGIYLVLLLILYIVMIQQSGCDGLIETTPNSEISFEMSHFVLQLAFHHFILALPLSERTILKGGWWAKQNTQINI